MSSNSDSEFFRRIKDTLDKGEQHLEPEIVQRLQRARIHATQSKPLTQWWVGATGIAVTAGIGILAFNLWIGQPMPHNGLPFEDVELLSGEQNLEFYRELEFYQWLEDEKQQS